VSLQERRRDRGFVLITVAICSLMLFGACGLVVDLGRMYVVRNELQIFADTAALAATLRLNGETGGITRARSEITTMRQSNYWHVATKPFTDASTTVTVAFGRSVTGGAPDVWTETPPEPPANYSFTRVTVRVPVPVYFMPLFTHSNSANVATSAIAGQLGSSDPSGMFPFTPVAHSRTPPSFGLTAGLQYTLKWASSPKSNGTNVCNGDQSQTWIDLASSRGADNRGFFGSQSAASELYAQVANDRPVDFFPLGSHIVLSGGAKSTVSSALVWRINSDPDPTSTTFNQYRDRGRYRRVVTVPLTDPAASNEVVGFGRFFLLPAAHYSGAGGNDPWCAEYIGPGAPEGSDSKAASPGTGMFTKVRLWH
jgi:Flp pilus assembly protein TadG